MPIRAVKQYSDRGKIKNLARAEDCYQPEEAPIPSELRMKRLVDFAESTKDKKLQSAMGFITTDYIADKNAIPLTAYRIRQVVADIKSRSSGQIDELSQEFQSCISFEKDPEAEAYWNNKQAMVKNASVRKPPAFWRARR